MTKAELISNIGDRLSTEADPAVIKEILELFTDEVKKAILNGQRVDLRNFGAFYPKYRKEKKGQDITRKRTVVIPACYIPGFKPSKGFKESVQKNIKT